MPKPPQGYHTPPFPSLNVKTLWDETSDRQYTLYFIKDIWWYTMLWTLIVYVFFHLGAVMIALFTHGWTKTSWKYIWIVPFGYLLVAGVQAVISGSIVGLMIGAVYHSGFWEMNTWIPFVWAFTSVMLLITSSFTIQSGL